MELRGQVRRRRALRIGGAYVAAVIVLAASAVAIWLTYRASTTPPRLAVASGRIVGSGTRAPREIRLRVAGSAVHVGRGGRFQTQPLARPAWLTATAPGWLPIARPVSPGSHLVVSLTRANSRTVTLAFVGDTLFGPRFLDANADGITTDALLGPSSPPGAYARFLRDVRPLLTSADVTVAELDGFMGRPAREAARNGLVAAPRFESFPNAAVALQRAGVDVVSLATSHLYDAGRKGVRATVAALGRAGFRAGRGRVGGGMTEPDAWRPAVVTARGVHLALLACTTIQGPPGPNGDPLNTARGLRKAGAARCNTKRLARETRRLHRRGYTVVVLLNGGAQYSPTPSATVRRLARVSRVGGAAVVVNEHPHVLGGLDWDGRSLAAWGLGQFMVEETLWRAFPSLLLRVAVRRDRVLQAFAFPLLAADFSTRAAGGSVAAAVSRQLIGRSRGPFTAHDGVAELERGQRSRERSRRARVLGSLTGRIYRVPAGAVVRSAPRGMQFGRDVLLVGGFEDETVHDGPTRASLWKIDSASERLGPAFAYDGALGLHVGRRAGDCRADTVSPVHRLPIGPDSSLSVLGAVRSEAGGAAGISLNWYTSTVGPAAARTYLPLVGSSTRWERFRADVKAPRWAVAVMPYIRVSPAPKKAARFDFDDLTLVVWARNPSAAVDYVRVHRRGTLRLGEPTPRRVRIRPPALLPLRGRTLVPGRPPLLPTCRPGSTITG